MTEEETSTPTPRSTPEPVVNNNTNKKGGGKKEQKKPATKIAIEEVEAPIAVVEEKKVVAVEQQQQQQQAKPSPRDRSQSKKNKNKGNKNPDNNQPKINRHDVGELIAVVKKTSFDDSEAQTLIDILLTKQSGAAVNDSMGWVENSKSENELQKLQNQLKDKQSQLEEESQRCKSVTDRMNQLRAEYNASKSQNASMQKVVEDLNARHQHEVSNMQMKLEGQIERYNLDISGLHETINFHVTQNTNLQATIEQQRLQQVAVQMDPAIFAELDQLRQAQASFEAERGQFHAQITAKSEEADKALKRVKELENFTEENKTLKVSYFSSELRKKNPSDTFYCTINIGD